MTSGKAAKERPDPKRGRGGNCGCGFEWKGETQDKTDRQTREGRGWIDWERARQCAVWMT